MEIWLEFALLFLDQLAAKIGQYLGHLATVAEDGEDGVFIQGGLDGDEALGERLVIGIDDGVDDILLAEVRCRPGRLSISRSLADFRIFFLLVKRGM